MAVDHRLSAVREWRAARESPGRLERVRLHAIDLLTDGAMPIDLLAGLDEDERLVYIEKAADNLAPELARFLDWWVLNDAP